MSLLYANTGIDLTCKSEIKWQSKSLGNEGLREKSVSNEIYLLYGAFYLSVLVTLGHTAEAT